MYCRCIIILTLFYIFLLFTFCYVCFILALLLHCYFCYIWILHMATFSLPLSWFFCNILLHFIFTFYILQCFLFHYHENATFVLQFCSFYTLLCLLYHYYILLHFTFYILLRLFYDYHGSVVYYRAGGQWPG